MKYRNFLTQAILTAAICLLTVFVFTTKKAEAWGPWIGFTDLCVSGSARGPEGTWLEFRIDNAVTYNTCYNINGGNLGQPGVGNSGTLFMTTEPLVGIKKKKGWVSIPPDTCISMDRFDMHFLLDENGEFILDGDEPILNPEHINEDADPPINLHSCWPTTNTEKIEQWNSTWIYEFDAYWEWWEEKKDGSIRIIKKGVDKCKWEDGWVEDGDPAEGVSFDCDEIVFKKK